MEYWQKMHQSNPCAVIPSPIHGFRLSSSFHLLFGTFVAGTRWALCQVVAKRPFSYSDCKRCKEHQECVFCLFVLIFRVSFEGPFPKWRKVGTEQLPELFSRFEVPVVTTVFDRIVVCRPRCSSVVLCTSVPKLKTRPRWQRRYTSVGRIDLVH